MIYSLSFGVGSSGGLITTLTPQSGVGSWGVL